VAGGQYPQFCRQPRAGGASEILLDGDRLAEGLPYFRFAGVYQSPDHRLVAYAADVNGSEYNTIRIRDLASGADLPDEITEAEGAAAWSACSKYLFYVRLDANHRPQRVYRHELGRPASEDELVYEESDSGFFVGLSETQNSRFILIESGDQETTEVRVLEATAPLSEPRLVAPRIPRQEYQIDQHGDDFIILNNSGGAEDFQICAAPVADPGRDSWRVIEPHRPGRLILSIAAFREHLVRLERENGLPRIVVRRLADGAEHDIAFAEEAYSLGLSPGYEFDTRILRFTYSSMTTPEQTFDYDMESRERTLRKAQEVPSGHDPADYVTRRVFAPAHDGERVPVSLLYRRETPLDGSAPLLLYGYGSYGVAIPASFSTGALSLVDRGFVYAIAHIRGGKDKGYRWYTDGKREKKANTFRDFIAAAEHLAAEKITSRGRIVAQGGSAGGMLMGAVANMAPDLWGGIIAEVPFVDVLTTMLDDTLPLTPPEWPEWGNPIESAADYATIAAYSPYDNVEAKAYPPIIAVAGLTDPRVTYWEPAKWVARLRALKTDANPLLLKTMMEAGHAGASGRFERLKEVAMVQAFALMATGRAGL
jgi:oligopeptidase B